MKKLFLALLLGVGMLFGQAPAQPNAPSYSVNELTMFKSYTRATYESEFGKQAPAFNPNRPVKNWFDSSKVCDSKNANVTYTVVSPNTSAPALDQLVIPSCEAASVNLKGALHYDVFRTAPSNVKLVCHLKDCQTQGVSPVLLSTEQEAIMLRAEIKGQTGVDLQITETTKLNDIFEYVKVDPNNPYGVYKIGSDNVGQLLFFRNQKGVGFPGTWKVTQYGAAFTAEADKPADNGSDATVPTPIRPLLGNEKLTTKVFGLIPVPWVERTDMNQPAAGDGSGGGFTNDDRLMLQRVFEMLNKLFAQ